MLLLVDCLLGFCRFISIDLLEMLGLILFKLLLLFLSLLNDLFLLNLNICGIGDGRNHISIYSEFKGLNSFNNDTSCQNCLLKYFNFSFDLLLEDDLLCLNNIFPIFLNLYTLILAIIDNLLMIGLIYFLSLFLIQSNLLI